MYIIAINIRVLRFQRWFFFMFSEKTHCGWLMKIVIYQHKLVVYYNSQICDEN